MRKPAKRYVVDGKLMKPADLRRLHERRLDDRAHQRRDQRPA